MNDVVKDIGDEVTRVHNAATQLSDRLRAFELWISGLPGRVEAETPGDGFRLRLCRTGKNWGLLVVFDSGEERPLSEAALKTKLASIGLLEDLLLAVKKSQGELVADIERGCQQIDMIFTRLGIAKP